MKLMVKTGEKKYLTSLILFQEDGIQSLDEDQF